MERCTEGIAFGAEGRGEEYPPVLRMAKAERVETGGRGRNARPIGAAARFRRMLRSGWQISTGLNLADDGDSGAGCGSEEHLRGITEAYARSFGCGGHARSARVLPGRRCAGHCSACLWN